MLDSLPILNTIGEHMFIFGTIVGIAGTLFVMRFKTQLIGLKNKAMRDVEKALDDEIKS